MPPREVSTGVHDKFGFISRQSNRRAVASVSAKNRKGIVGHVAVDVFCGFGADSPVPTLRVGLFDLSVGFSSAFFFYARPEGPLRVSEELKGQELRWAGRSRHIHLEPYFGGRLATRVGIADQIDLESEGKTYQRIANPANGSALGGLTANWLV